MNGHQLHRLSGNGILRTAQEHLTDNAPETKQVLNQEVLILWYLVLLAAFWQPKSGSCAILLICRTVADKQIPFFGNAHIVPYRHINK